MNSSLCQNYKSTAQFKNLNGKEEQVVYEQQIEKVQQVLTQGSTELTVGVKAHT